MTEHPEDQPNGGEQQPSKVAGQTTPVSEQPEEPVLQADTTEQPSAEPTTEQPEESVLQADTTEQPPAEPTEQVEALAVAVDASPTPSGDAEAASEDSPEATDETSLRQQSSALLDLLVETYPTVFLPFTARQVKPLKIGIHKDLETTIKAWGFSTPVLKIALSRYTRARRYQVALLKETQRLDLEGQEAGEVSDENREIAQNRINELNEKRKQQQAAIKAAKSVGGNTGGGAAAPPGARPRPRSEPRKPQRGRKARDPRATRPANSDAQQPPAEHAATPAPTPAAAPSRSRSSQQRKKPSSGPREPSVEKLAALAAKFNTRS